MTCDCGVETTKGFPATSEDGSSFHPEWMSGEISVGKFGVEDRDNRERIDVAAWPAKSAESWSSVSSQAKRGCWTRKPRRCRQGKMRPLQR